MIIIKTPEEVNIMREGGKILAEVLNELKKAAKPGVTTKSLDILAADIINKKGASSAFLNYRGFPAVLCTSINDEIVHGLPSDRKLKNGDVLKLDTGVLYKGFNTDSALTIIVGALVGKIFTSHKKKKLLSVTRKALEIGISFAKPGKNLGDMGFAIQDYVHRQGFEVVRDLVGHGIGKSLHEEPEVANCGKKGLGPQLKPGMVIAIEPMVVTGGYEISEGVDGFAFKTKDGGLAAHFEHTVAITEDGNLVLTAS